MISDEVIVQADATKYIPPTDVQLIITSPPYNTNWNYGDNGIVDNLPLEEYQSFLQRFLENSWWSLRDGGVLALNLPASITVYEDEKRKKKRYRAFPIASWADMQLINNGWLPRGNVAWVKSNPNAPVYSTGTAIGAATNPFMRNCWEMWLLYSKNDYRIPNKPARWPGESDAFKSYLELCKDVRLVRPGRAKKGQPLAFPESMVHDWITLFSCEGDYVMDPFAGSGTVGKVAREMGRKFILLDNNPDYVESMRERFASTCLSDASASAA